MYRMRRVLANSSSAARKGYLSFSGALANGVLSIQLRKRILTFLQRGRQVMARVGYRLRGAASRSNERRMGGGCCAVGS
jgi:hypothetical protein